MDRGQRLQLTQRVASTLAADGWSADIDRTLETFGFPTTDQWNGGSPYDYVCDMLVRGTVEDLVELNAFVHPDDVPMIAHDDGAAVWGGEGFRLFMSHTTPHKVFVTQVADALSTWGLRAFVAHKDITPTTAWQSAITTALNTCDALCAFLTEDFRSSAWCDQEVGFALGRSKLLVPLKLDVDPHGFMGAVQALPMRMTPWSPWEVGSDILKALAANEMTKKAMLGPVIKWFGESGSFAATRDRFPVLTSLPATAWSDERVAQVRVRLRENTQLAQAYLPTGEGVPQAVESYWTGLGILDDIPF